MHRLVLAGGISPHRAAIACGFRKQPGRRPKPRPVDPSELTRAQEMELWLGASDSGSSFADEMQRRTAWFRHRGRLMGYWGCHGKRPQAWWLYEAPVELYYPGPDYERSTLFEFGLLAETERAELLANWRREFNRANAPGFFYCAGAGKFLDGEEARAAHYRWADIPDTLVEEWSAELQHKKEGPCSETAQSPQSTSTHT
jgi:hypothetical protein